MFLALFSFLACAPQNATMTGGEFTMLMSLNSSLILINETIDPEDFDEHWQVDCREVPIGEEETFDKLENPIDVCNNDAWPPVHEGWLNIDGYEVVSEPIEPWRGEAIMTWEGDFQMTFHHHLPSGEDFRFAVVVDPNFQPRACVQSEDGTDVEWENLDGDWIENWSADIGGPDWTGTGTSGVLYYLNAGAYQFNPSSTDQSWSLQRDWRAGYTTAKFGEEDFGRRTTRYGLPESYASFELDDAYELAPENLFYTAMAEGADPTTDLDFQAQITEVREVAERVSAEFGLAQVEFKPMVHTNEWRTPDGIPSGLDAWVGLHYNWVRFDEGSTLEVGGNASGEFQLVYDAADGQSRLFVSGNFEVDKIKKDRWVVDDLEQTKLEENETVLCGESYAAE